MGKMEIFRNKEFGEIRTLVINEEPWFVGKDISNILGYQNGNRDIVRHVCEEDRKMISNDEFKKLSTETVSSLGQRGGWLINESGLYSLILSSKLKSAKRFKRWVTSEVLPAIRKHGAYMTEDTIEKALTSPDFLIQLATKLKEEKEARRLAEEKIEKQKPLVDFANKVSNSGNLIDMGKMAKLLQDENLDIGRNRLFKWLRDHRILMKNNIPYQKYIDAGYFQVKEYIRQIPNGIQTEQITLITGKGQVYIAEKVKKDFSAF